MARVLTKKFNINKIDIVQSLSEFFRFMICILLSLIVAVMVGLKSDAATLVSAEQIKGELLNQFGAQLKKQGYSDVEINIVNIPFQSLSVPDGKMVIKIADDGERIYPRQYKKIEILVNGAVSKVFGLQVELKAYKNVLVAKEAISKDASINSSNAEVKRIDVTSTLAYPADSRKLSENLVATKMFRANEIIDTRFIKTKPDVLNQAVVKVVFVSGDELSITVEAVAMKEGNIGDYISVQNRDYRKIYNGKIIAENTVLVRI